MIAARFVGAVHEPPLRQDANNAVLEREMALLDELFRTLLEELMTERLSVAGLT